MVRIDSTKFGSITIDGKIHYDWDNYIISWDDEIKGLHTSQRHVFGKQELNMILKKKPEIIVIGIGDTGLLKVDDGVRTSCRQMGIELIEMISRRAITKFNEAFNNGKKVVAFIHVTC